jgi:uncharacterized membrane protein (UPF0127 family)
MMHVLKRPDGKILIPRLEVASTLWRRTRGLLGRSELPADRALWILRCNSIHTFFMKFPIDVVFLNRRMQVTKTFARVKPWRMIWPIFSASSVIEFSEGFLEKNPVRIGEELHVDRSLS